MISDTKARMRLDDLNKFDWGRTDRDQGNFDTKMMIFSWFDKVASYERKRVQLDLQQSLASQPIPIKGVVARATLEVDPEKRP